MNIIDDNERFAEAATTPMVAVRRADGTPITTIDTTAVAVSVAEDARPVAVNVIAPAELSEGSTFHAEVDGITFLAVVPEGGVRKDQSFRFTYPTRNINGSNDDNNDNSNNNFNNNNNNNNHGLTFPPTADQIPFQVPTGAWRDDLHNKLCCMAFFCSFVVHAQMIQRLKLSLGCCPRNCNKANDDPRLRYLVIGISLSLLASIPMWHIFFRSWQLVSLVLGLIVWVVMIRTRRSMRERYDIPGDCCDDFCITTFCSCCSAMQMASHTHDLSQYPYKCCSLTGLGAGAPKILTV